MTISTSLQSSVDRQTIREFLDGDLAFYAVPDPAWGPIGQEVFNRTYSRDVDVVDNNGRVIATRRESWAETVRRVVNGSMSYLPRELWLPNEDVDLFELIYNFRAIPAGRHLWVTGTPVATLSKNCWSSGFGERTSSHFTFLAARLLEGGGVGSNYSFDELAKTAPVRRRVGLTFSIARNHPDYDRVEAVVGDLLNSSLIANETIHVDDSREGWVDTWGRVIDAATESGDDVVIAIDLDAIRPFGAVLKTFGGTASGPDALVRSLIGVTSVINAVLDAAPCGRHLTGLEAMAIDHELAAAVVAGGSRRSARMSIMTWRDPEIFDFIHVKEESHSHWTTNISVEIDDEFREALNDGTHPQHLHASEVMREVSIGMARNGEPGLVDTEFGSRNENVPVRTTNPCGEIFLNSYDVDGVIAGESCNLGSVDLDSFGDDTVGLERAFELMARFLYRSTLNPHEDARASHIEATNRRIGVGIMGLQGWCAAHGARLSELTDREDLRDLLTGFRSTVRRAADDLADALALPRPIKVTAVAPTGTIAQLRGTQPGVHPVFARHFIRRVRYSHADPAVAAYAAAGFPVFDDTYAANTSVVEFVVRDSILDRFSAELIEQSDEIDADAFFSIVSTVQETFCGGADGNAVSATAQISPDTAPEALVASLKKFLGRVKGVTVFPAVSRPLSPYESISQERYEEAVANGLAQASGDSNSGECVGGVCPVR